MSAPGLAAARGAFAEYFRAPAGIARFDVEGELSGTAGYFTMDGALCYGRVAGASPAAYVTAGAPEVGRAVTSCRGRVGLPFDLTDAVTNLRRERYSQAPPSYLRELLTPAARSLYYFFRPALTVGLRRHLQKLHLGGWRQIAFPRWPVDVTVDELMHRSMRRAIEANNGCAIPFVWFWPDGASACAMLTHDVEGPAGEEFCGTLMDLDASFGITSAFQLVPEAGGRSAAPLMRAIRARGFEANLHDLNHDGHLFASREEFEQRARQINRYARELECEGFRSGAMYREQDWYDAFELAYDMSVPNVAHLEPQRGGCCTVMPYFVGRLLELPLTTTQDYSLFHILRDYSTALWREQIARIRSYHGLISVITHPDYLLGPREQAVYRELLQELARLREEDGVWISLPGEINRWWRERHQMNVVSGADGCWRIEGPGSARARLAWARLDGDRVAFTVDPQ